MNAEHSRRRFLALSGRVAGAAVASMFPPAIRNALAIAAHNRNGTLRDVEHIVVFTQENRAFDHYFGSLRGVRGFADRFPIPVPDTADLTGKTVWFQRNDAVAAGEPRILAPQHNDTAQNFALIRSAGTPHLYPDAQDAWDGGRMTSWPRYKHDASMVYYEERDLPFQFALANAFTIADANHCSFTGGTNPNRCYLFTGTNHGNGAEPGSYNGPALDNSYNTLKKGAVPTGYTWMTYPERLEDAGISWQVYQNNENEYYALNPLFGFSAFRAAHAASTPEVSPARTPRQQALYERGIRTRDLDLLKADVLAGRLPQVAWICATSSGCEHPSASSPAQGAAYTAQVLDALTADPEVWSKTVLLVNFDENDGLFDHVPPPAPPSCLHWDADPANARFAGTSSVDASDEYLGDALGGVASAAAYRHHPFGLGPRVPLYVISPWSKGGWVNSQVFDPTSTIRLIEARFGVAEPNISAWRRAVTGDLTSCFNFATPNDADVIQRLPATRARDRASRALGKTTTPSPAAMPVLPSQQQGTRPSRALPYELHANAEVALGGTQVRLTFANTGRAAAVFHVYDRRHLEDVPRRYTVEAGKQLSDTWEVAADGITAERAYDLWVLAPNGFHRHFTGRLAEPGTNPQARLHYEVADNAVSLTVHNSGTAACEVRVVANAYFSDGPWAASVAPQREWVRRWPLDASGSWYDFTLMVATLPGYTRRFAGRLETGRDSVSDPAMGGLAVGDQRKVD